MPVDMHMHSSASDGALAPAALVALCAQERVRLMSLTDHDTMAGVPEAVKERYISAPDQCSEN